MANLIGALADIGEIYLDREKEIYNETVLETRPIYSYIFDIKTKQLEPFSISSKEKFIICKNGDSTTSPYIYPIGDFSKGESWGKKIQSTLFHFTKGVKRKRGKKENKLFLDFFTEDEIKNNEILSILSNLDNDFFNECEKRLKSIHKETKNPKPRYIVALSYQGKPICEYFPEIYDLSLDEALSGTDDIYGYDILNNTQGVGGDACLPFLSVAKEIGEKYQRKEKSRLLSLSHNSARKIKLGQKVLLKLLSYQFGKIKIAIIPTVLNGSMSLKDILNIIAKEVKESKITKDSIIGQKKAEKKIIYKLNPFLENISHAENQYLIVNTLLFFREKNSEVALLLTIDDVLPSYITRLSELMNKYKISAFGSDINAESFEHSVISLYYLLVREKSKDGMGIKNNIKVMDFLLSREKIDVNFIIVRYSELILKGQDSFKWSDYLCESKKYLANSIKAIERYQSFFNKIDILTEKIILKRKEMNNFTEEELSEIIMDNKFLSQSSIHKSAYLLGTFCRAILAWQYTVRGTSDTSFSRWLNNLGYITQDKLLTINQECLVTAGKLSRESLGEKNSKVEVIKKILLHFLAEASVETIMAPKEQLILAFSMGGTDCDTFIKKQTEEKKKEKDESKNKDIGDSATEIQQNLFLI